MKRHGFQYFIIIFFFKYFKAQITKEHFFFFLQRIFKLSNRFKDNGYLRVHIIKHIRTYY